MFLLAQALLDQQENRAVFGLCNDGRAGERAGGGGLGAGVGPRMEDAQRRLLHEKRARHAGEGIGTSCTCARGRRRL